VHLVAEPVVPQHLGNAVLDHPGFMAMAQAVRHQAGFDRQPGRQRQVLVEVEPGPAAATRRRPVLARNSPWPGRSGVDQHRPRGAGSLAAFLWITAVDRGTPDASVVARAPVVPPVGAEEQVLPLALAEVALAAAAAVRVGLRLAGEQVGEERRQVDGPDGVVLERGLGEAPVELGDLPVELDGREPQPRPFQADGLAPPHAGPAHGDHEDEVVVLAGQHGGSLGD
jgi:hypothetical protein